MYPAYKGQRPPTPEPISEALKQLKDLLRVMAIPEIVVPGIEADDVIGTMSYRALQQGFQVAIASPDKVSKSVGQVQNVLVSAQTFMKAALSVHPDIMARVISCALGNMSSHNCAGMTRVTVYARAIYVNTNAQTSAWCSAYCSSYQLTCILCSEYCLI